MRIRYYGGVVEARYDPLAAGRAVGLRYAGEIIVPERPADATSAATTLHEMAHVLVVDICGIAEAEAERFEDAVPSEAQASALALAWIAPAYYTEAYEHLIDALRSYLFADDNADAYELLDDAIDEVTGMWARPRVDKRQLQLGLDA